MGFPQPGQVGAASETCFPQAEQLMGAIRASLREFAYPQTESASYELARSSWRSTMISGAGGQPDGVSRRPGSGP